MTERADRSERAKMQRESLIAAYVAERAGYQLRGMTSRAAEVTTILRKLDHKEDDSRVADTRAVPTTEKGRVR